MNKHINIAIEAVRQASRVCYEIQSQLVSSDSLTKKDRSPVTIADFASQAIICRELHKQFPDIPIVGEEDAATLRKPENNHLLEKISSFLPGWTHEGILNSIDLGDKDTAPLFWTLDPIDGTKGFLRGDQYAVALALIKEGEIQLGVLGCPNLPFESNQNNGTIFYSQKGKSSFKIPLTGDTIVPIKVSDLGPTDEVRFLESVEAGHANHDLQAKIIGHFEGRAKSVKVDSQVKYGVLANGGAEVYLRMPNPSKPDYREKIWDHAAGVIIVEEAGGKITDIFGKPLDFTVGSKLKNNRGVIVSNNQFHDVIISQIDLNKVIP